VYSFSDHLFQSDDMEFSIRRSVAGPDTWVLTIDSGRNRLMDSVTIKVILQTADVKRLRDTLTKRVRFAPRKDKKKDG